MNIIRKILLYVFILNVGLSLHIKAQQKFTFSYLTVENGLSSNRISAIYRDSKGFVWIGTYGGLNKFDGLNFQSYYYDKSNTNTLSDNNITSIYEDKNKQIWVGTLDGLNLYQPNKDNFIVLKKNASTNSIPHNFINKIISDKDSNIWIATYDGICKYINTQNGFKTFKFFDGVNNLKNGISDIVCDSNNIIWAISQTNSLIKFNVKDEKAEIVEMPNYVPSANNYKRLCIDKSGTLWIATELIGLIAYNTHNNTFRQIRFNGGINGTSGSFIKAIYPYTQNKILIASDQKGLDILDTKTLKIDHIKANSSNPGDLNSNGIWSFFLDHENILWIGSSTSGVNIFNPKEFKFKKYKHIVQNNNTIPNNPVLSFLEDSKGNIWIGTDGGGLSKFDPKTGSFLNFKNDPNNPQSISSNVILAIAEDKEGYLWLATWGGGVCRYNYKTNSFQKYTKRSKPNTNISTESIWTLIIDNEDNLWLNLFDNGIEVHNLKNNSIKYYAPDSADLQSKIGYNFCKFINSPNGTVWVIKNNSVNKYNRKTEKIELLRNFSEEILWTACESRSGNLWLGTDKNGIIEITASGNTVKNITTSSGLPNNKINGILEDRLGYLWVSTNNGLCRINPKDYSVRTYNVSDGLQGKIFKENSCLKTINGDLYFGGINGFNTFSPDSLKDNTFLPTAYISEFQIYNKTVLPNFSGSVLKRPIYETSNLELSYKHSFFAFKLSAINITHPENCMYAYKMEGFDKEWITTDINRLYASYTNLDPGKYIFKVRASNNDGVWSNEGQSIVITIEPPFYKTIWLKLILLIIIILSIILFIQLRINIIKRQKIILENLVEKRTHELGELNKSKDRFISIMAHDIKNPLGGVLGVIDILRDDYNGMNDAERLELVQSISKSTNQLNNLLDNLLHWLRSSSGRIPFNPEHVNPFKLTENIIELLKASSETKHLIIDNNISPSLNIVADKNQIQLILRNLISNAIKYSFENGTIYINSKNSDSSVILEIKDEGIGIDTNKIDLLFKLDSHFSIPGTHNEKGTGLGLLLCAESIKNHSGKIWIESEKGKGATFYVQLPKEQK